jgi:hypothetical protein
MTKEQEFYWRLKNDRAWYIENFLKIRDKRAQIIPFKLNKAQKIVLDIIKRDEEAGKPKRYLVLKARQMGLSTLFEGLIFHDTSTNENKNSLIIAHEEQASSNLFNMSKLYFENIPDVIRPLKKYANGKVLSFENPESDEAIKRENPGLRSKISIATAGSGEVGRSATYHNIHASEVAFFPDAKVTMLGLMQSVPDQPNTMVVLETTANGVGDWFHEQWVQAEKGLNEFTPIFLPWHIQPEYTRPFFTDEERISFIESVDMITQDMNGNPVRTYEYELMQKHDLTYEQLNWRKYTIRNKCQGDDILFMQEYPSTPEEAFISSGRPKFNIRSLRAYQNQQKEPIKTGYLRENETGEVEFYEDPKGYVSIWVEPSSKYSYSIGADVAEGLATGDFSAAYVGNDEFDIVARWYGHIDPDLFGEELAKLGKYYNHAYLGVESNNHGLTTIKSIIRKDYPNIYHMKSFEKISDDYTPKVGWHTNQRSKPLMIDKLAEFIREKYLGIPDPLLISEMFTYIIEDNGKTNGQAGTHDDTVMACGIMLQLLLEGFHDSYVPEVPVDERGKDRVQDIVDPLFETDSNEEWSD